MSVKKRLRIHKDIDINFVSLCKQGANPYSYIEFLKEKEMSDNQQDVTITIDEESLSNAIAKALKVNDEAQIEAIKSSVAGVLAPLIGQIQELEKSYRTIQTVEDETLIVEGTTISKSVVGETVFEAMKKANESLLAKNHEIQKMAAEARAEKDYPFVAGTVSEKGEFLMDIEKYLPEKSCNYAKSLLGALNQKVEDLSKSVTIATSESAESDKFYSEVDAYAKTYNKSYAESFIEVAKNMGDKFYNRGE